MGRFNISSHNLARQQLLELQQQNLTSLEETEQSIASLTPRKFKSSDPVLGFKDEVEEEVEEEIDPLEDFLAIQYEAKRRGLDVSVLAGQPFGEQVSQQLGRSNPGYLISGKGIDKITTRKELDEYVSNTPLDFTKEEEDEIESGTLGRIVREAKSFFIGDSKKEMILNIGLMAIPATLPLKGLHLGIKAGIRLAGKKSVTILEGTKEVKLLVKFVKEAGRISPEVQIARTAVTKQRVSRAKKAMVAFDERDRPLRRLKRSRVVQKGPLPSERMKKPLVTMKEAKRREALIAKQVKTGKPISEVMDEAGPEGITWIQRDKLMTMVLDSNQDIFTRQIAGFGIYNLVNFGSLPTLSTLKAMEKTLGKELGKEIRKAIPKWKRFEEGLIDVLSLPKTIVSSFDVSAPFRQGFFLIGHYKQFFEASTAMFRAMGSQASADRIALEIAERPTARMSKQAGLFLSDALNNAEEAFMSKFANLIPGVRQSARAYTTFLNKLRADVFDQMYYSWTKGTYKATPEDVDGLARWINRATGRGSLGPLEQFRGALNVGIFSPAFVMSRFQIPISILEKSVAVRKMVVRDIASATAVSGTAIALMIAAGAKIGTDPNTADFGKGMIGNTRIDMGAGMLPIWKLSAQLLTGKRDTTGLGEEQKLERLDIMTRFLRTKLSPTGSLLTDIYEKETLLGDDFVVSHLATGEEIRQRLAPLFIQDLADAIEEHGWLSGTALGMPAAFGVGVATYSNLWGRRKEAFKEMFPKKNFEKEWDIRGDALIRTLDSHPLVIKELEELESKDNIHEQEYRDVAKERYLALKEEKEAEFREKVIAGRIQGKALWDMAKSLNQEKYASANAFWYGLEGDILAGIEPRTAADLLATRYWSVDLDEDPVTGDFDWKGMEEKRAVILQDAREQNVRLEYVMGTGPSSFRGTRYEDPIVAEVMNRYEDDKVLLREYWDIGELAFDRNPGAKDIRDRIIVARATGESPRIVKALESHPVYKRYQKEKLQISKMVRERNPSLEARLYFWGFIDNLSSVYSTIALQRLSFSYLTNLE